MDMEAGKTLTNEEVIRELLDLLKKNAMKEQANDVFEICSYVDGLEKKIDSMTEELTNMQNQIKEMQEDTLVNNAKKALSEAQEQLNARCEQIKSQVLEVKAQVKSTAKSIVDEAKAKGRAALYRVSDCLGIKKRLLDIRENVRGAIKTTDKDIAKTALLAKGFREAGQTAANAFRTFADKPEVDYSQKEQKHSITKVVLAPMKAVKKILVSMELHLDASIDKLDNLAMNVKLDKEKHMENAKAHEQTEPERAGAERVEGTLFGNGERTGNVDILNIAYNMFSQGINPELNIEKVNEIIEIYERCCKIPIHPRHPYAGKLVFTAFSGSHQDAINKGVKAMKERGSEFWQVPYLPIDPSDIGREYEPIVRINSQSGKGGVAFIMDTYFGFKLPKGMHKEFANVIQSISEKQGEVSPDEIMTAFRTEYLDRKEPIHFRKLKVDDLSGETQSEFDTRVFVTYTDAGVEKTFEAVGNGPIDAVQRGLQQELDIAIKILDYEEHALQSGSNSQAAAYIHLLDSDSGSVTYGVGVSSNITRASVRAIFSAVNRLGLGK